MNEKWSNELIDQIAISNRKYSMLISQVNDLGGWDECGFEKDKLLQMIALSFDIVDALGKKYPHLAIDENGTEH